MIDARGENVRPRRSSISMRSPNLATCGRRFPTRASRRAAPGAVRTGAPDLPHTAARRRCAPPPSRRRPFPARARSATRIHIATGCSASAPRRMRIARLLQSSYPARCAASCSSTCSRSGSDNSARSDSGRTTAGRRNPTAIGETTSREISRSACREIVGRGERRNGGPPLHTAQVEVASSDLRQRQRRIAAQTARIATAILRFGRALS